MELVRCNLIGIGRAGLVHARNLRYRMKNVLLRGLCDANVEELEKAGKEFGVEKLFTDYHEAVGQPEVDAVIIATPTYLHRQVACAAAQQGKHVFLEKPMAITREECEAINEAVEKAGVRLQIGFMRRFSDNFVKAKAILDSGKMGRVMTIRSIGRGPGLPPRWIYDISKSNGILGEVNSHDFDSVRWLTGSEISRVYAEGGNYKCLDIKEEYPDFYDNAVVSLCLENGALGVIEGTCPCHYGYDARVEVLCAEGVLKIGTTEQSGLIEVQRDGYQAEEVVKSWQSLFKDAYLAEMEHFVECVAADRPPRVGGEDGLRAVEAVLAANRSLRIGQSVEVVQRGRR